MSQQKQRLNLSNNLWKNALQRGRYIFSPPIHFRTKIRDLRVSFSVRVKVSQAKHATI
jgi:hypothetical protein